MWLIRGTKDIENQVHGFQFFRIDFCDVQFHGSEGVETIVGRFIDDKLLV
jgi:hypothetical protein